MAKRNSRESIKDEDQIKIEERTSIFIAHRLITIKKADRIFVIKKGRLVEMGSHTELTSLNNGIYSNLLRLQLH